MVTAHMMANLISPAWVTFVLVCAVLVRQRLNRQTFSPLLRLTSTNERVSTHAAPVDAQAKQGVFAKVGLQVIRILPSTIRPYADPKLLGIICTLTTVTVPFSPIRSICLAVLGILVLVARAKRLRITHERVLRREFPVLVDLLGVAVQSGRTLVHSIEFVCADHEGELHQRLLHCARSIETGTRFVDALQDLSTPGSGDHLSTLVATLISAERYGVSLPLALHELASDVRDLRRRQGESEARRVPIRMLGPLILLLLPSFALLTVAPLLASGLSSLRL